MIRVKKLNNVLCNADSIVYKRTTNKWKQDLQSRTSDDTKIRHIPPALTSRGFKDYKIYHTEANAGT